MNPECCFYYLSEIIERHWVWNMWWRSVGANNLSRVSLDTIQSSKSATKLTGIA